MVVESDTAEVLKLSRFKLNELLEKDDVSPVFVFSAGQILIVLFLVRCLRLGSGSI